MHPVLFTIGGVEFYSYGLMLGLGFAAGVYVATRRAEKHGMSADSLFWMFIWLLIGGVIGGRLFHVALNYRYYTSLISVLDTREGGMSIHGVLLGGLLVAWLYARRHKIGFGYLLDIVVPGVALGQAIGRIGCLFSGCCYGVQTSGTWGVITRFAPGLRHPYQLYESAADLLIFFLLLRLSDKGKVNRDGRLFAVYIMAYSAARFFLEFFRDNDSYLAGLSYGQWGSIIGIAVGCCIWFLARRRSPDADIVAGGE